MAERYYVEDPLKADETLTLAGTEAHHLINVMRAKPGQVVQLFDGQGAQAEAEILSTSRRDVELQIQKVEVVDRRPLKKVLVAAAIPKGDRLRFLVEKLSELGAAAWLPLKTQRSVNPLNPSTEKKIRQWTIDACKQSERNHLLDCLPLTDFAAVLQQFQSVPTKTIAAAPANQSTLNDAPAGPEGNHQVDHQQPANEMLFDQIILVGPEGGFTDEEVLTATQAGYEGQMLGELVLRIETAAVAMLTDSLF